MGEPQAFLSCTIWTAFQRSNVHMWGFNLEKVIKTIVYMYCRGKAASDCNLWFWSVCLRVGTPIPLGKGCSFLSLGGKCKWIFALYCDSNKLSQISWCSGAPSEWLYFQPHYPHQAGPSLSPFSHLGDSHLQAQLCQSLSPSLSGRAKCPQARPHQWCSLESAVLLVN